MAERSVLVRLRAEVGSFVSEMDRAAKATEKVAKKSQESEAAASGALGKMVRSATDHGAAWEATGVTVAAAGAGILAVVGAVVAAYSDFDKAMSTVAADTRATGQTLEQLRTAAVEMGAATSFSATEAAYAIDELAKAGVATSDILGGGLAGSMALAAAGGLDVAKSAEIASAAMVQFGLGGDQVSHIADLLAAGAGKALGSVEDLGMALNQGGLVAAQMGLSIEETTGTLAAFASAGLKGSDAGTSLKTMLLMLANPSEKASRTMSELGIAAYDASGNFVGMESLAGQLQTKLGGLSQAQRDQAMATIFGSDAIRAANVLFTQGSGGIADWTQKVNDQGYAAEQAAIKLDNLAGDWEYLLGDLDALALQSGGSLNDSLRGLVQGADDAVEAFSALPDPIQQGAIQMGAMAGVGLLAGGAFLMIAPRVLETVNSFRQLSTDMPELTGKLGKVGAVVGAAAAAFAALQVASVLAGTGTYQAAGLGESTKALVDLTKGATDASAAVDRLAYANGSGGAEIRNLGEAVQAVNWGAFRSGAELVASGFGIWDNAGKMAQESIGGIDDALAQMVNGGQTDLAADAFARLSEQALAQGATLEEVQAAFPGYQDALDSAAAAADAAGPSADQLASSVTGVGAATADTADIVEGFSDALDAMLAQFFSVDEAADAFQSKINGLAEAVKTNGKELEGTTDKAIANREALRSTADAAANLLTKMAEQGASSQEVSAKAAELKQAFMDQAAQLGLTGAEVDKVAASYDAMPRLVEITLQANGMDELSVRAQTLADRLNAIPRSVKVSVQQTESYIRQEQAQANRQGVMRADGGLIPLGLGGPREDNVLTWTSSGEYVINAAATSRYLPIIEAINAQKLADGGLVRGGNVLRDRGLGAASSTSTKAPTDPGAYAITTGSILSGLTASDAAPGAAAAYAVALDAQAAAAGRAEAAERSLDAIRERAQRRLEWMKDDAEAAEEALKESQAAAIEAAEKDLDAMKRRNDDTLQALKDRQQAELDASRAKKNNSAATSALQKRQDAEERALKRKLEDEEEAAQDRIAQAKKDNTKASKELAKANDDLYDRAKESAAAAEEAATKKLKDAKDADAAASKAAAEAERVLNEQRQKAQQLAEQTADAIRRNATLTAALADRGPQNLSATGDALSDASAAADTAARAKRDESAAEAAKRRADALQELVTAAGAYATAQRAMGLSDATIGATLDQVGAKVADLGVRYGLSSAAIEKLSGQLASQRTTAESVLASFSRQAAISAEFSQAISALQSAGLSPELIDQVVAGGTTDGLTLARAILAGGSGTIGRLNGTQAGLNSYANAAGSQLAAGRYGSGAYFASSPNYGSITSTLDAASQALLQNVLTAVASRPAVLVANGQKLAETVNAYNADAAYGRTAP